MKTLAERLGYTTQSPKAPASAPLAREQAARRLYSTRHDGASVELAVASCFDRLESRLRDDPERLAQLRSDRRGVQRVLEERGVSHEDAHAMLSTYLAHANNKRSPETIAQRWPHEFERIRLAAGSTQAAEKVVENAKQLYQAIAEAAPTFANSVAASGAAESAAMIQAAARYPTPPAPPPAAA